MRAPLLAIGLCVWITSSLFSQEGVETPRVENAPKTTFAHLFTSKGEIVCELFSHEAPLSTEAFIHLSKEGIYNGFKFYRVIEGNALVLAGDPLNLYDSATEVIPQEIGHPHEEGALAWARLPDHLNEAKDSLTSQFYITSKALPNLDGQYTVFGKVISGLPIVKEIELGDKIEKIEITQN